MPDQPTSRQLKIFEMLGYHKSLAVEALAQRFGVTNQTIRRDLQRLCDYGLARRRHGGVEQLVLTRNQAYTSRQILNSTAKAAIAAEVARCIPDGASLAFSIGTTPELVAQYLTGHQNLNIITNNLNVAMALAASPTAIITVAGGRMRNDDRDILGAAAESLFAAYKVDFGIFGVAGVDADGTLLDFDEAEVAIRQTILANCRTSFLVLDYSKFGRVAHVRGGSVTHVSRIFCDQQPPEGILALLEGFATETVICPLPGRRDDEEEGQ